MCVRVHVGTHVQQGDEKQKDFLQENDHSLVIVNPLWHKISSLL